MSPAVFYTLVAKDSLNSGCKFVALPTQHRRTVERAGGLTLGSVRLAKYLADQESAPHALGRFSESVRFAGMRLWIPDDLSATLGRIEELAVMLVLGA